MIENVAPKQVWQALMTDPDARLVDVRTPMEWEHVGVPDLAETGKTPVLLSWQVAPSMQVNRNFVAEMEAAGIGPEHSVYFLCRSGVRSLAAAAASEAAGFGKVFNIANGFEGPPDRTGERGTVSGWQAEGMAWKKG